MDDPDLDPGLHAQALRALGRVNVVSLAARRVWREVGRLHREGREPVRVLDLACGGGDVLRAVARRARRRGVAVRLQGCDLSPVALAEARRAAGGDEALLFTEIDVGRDALPADNDLVCASLFLHHLSDEAAVRLLAAMAEATADTLLVQDLRRTRLGVAFAFIGLHVLTRSSVARDDGLASVRAAFTVAEARRLCREAGLEGAEVRRCWPQRFTIRWRRSAASERRGATRHDAGALAGSREAPA